MIDAHVHIFHGNSGEYTINLVNHFATQAKQRGITELFLLEHTHQFYEFAQVYEPVAAYNEYQKNWLARKMKASLGTYTSFIDSINGHKFTVEIKFGLETCYIPETAHLLSDILKQYHWDFVTGSIHYIDGWGFDHKSEFWSGVEVNKAYRRYYEIMLAAIPEPGMNINMLRAFKNNNVRILTASDAHKLEHTGMYIEDLLEKIVG